MVASARDAPTLPRGPFDLAPISSVTSPLRAGRRIPARRIPKIQRSSGATQSRAKRREEKGESEEHAEQQSREQRMKLGAIEGEKRGGAGKFAERVEVGDGSRDQRGDCGGAGGAREGGAL